MPLFGKISGHQPEKAFPGRLCRLDLGEYSDNDQPPSQIVSNAIAVPNKLITILMSVNFL